MGIVKGMILGTAVGAISGGAAGIEVVRASERMFQAQGGHLPPANALASARRTGQKVGFMVGAVSGGTVGTLDAIRYGDY